MLKYSVSHPPTPSVYFRFICLRYSFKYFCICILFLFLFLTFLSVSHRICAEVRCLPTVTRAVVAPTPAMGGSAPGRAVLLPPMLREASTSLLWVCAFPRRNAILLLLCVHMSVSATYACLPTPTMEGSAPGRPVLLSPMLRETATSLFWVCAFPRPNTIAVCPHAPLSIAVI